MKVSSSVEDTENLKDLPCGIVLAKSVEIKENIIDEIFARKKI